MIQIQIVIPPIVGEKVYWDSPKYQFWDVSGPVPQDCYDMLYDNMLYDKLNLYAQRPDGTWYIIKNFRALPRSVDQQLHDLIESGMEPYRAFEVMAL